jgi:integrase
MLQSWKRERSSLALSFAQPDAIVFGNLDGKHVGPKRLTRNFGNAVMRCRKVHTDLPAITLHGLRHTHVSVLLARGVPVKTVSSRVGHRSPPVYAHLFGGDDEGAASAFASLVDTRVSDSYQGSSPGSAQQAGEGL